MMLTYLHLNTFTSKNLKDRNKQFQQQHNVYFIMDCSRALELDHCYTFSIEIIIAFMLKEVDRFGKPFANGKVTH